MGLLTGGGAAVLNSVFASIYPTGTLVRRTITEDAGGSQTITETTVAIKVQTDGVTEAMRTASGYTDTDVRLIVLTSGLGGDITTDDVIVDGRGDAWAVTMPSLDTCGSHWEVRGQRTTYQSGFIGTDLNFAAGNYAENDDYSSSLPPSWSFSRAGSAVAFGADGEGFVFAANAPRITSAGLYLESAKTNKVAIQNVNPSSLTGLTKSGDAAAVLSIVDDSAQLSDAGLLGICTSGTVFKLDNSLGVANSQVLFAGMTGNTAVHVVSMYVRGSGTVRFGLSVGFATAVTVPAAWTRLFTSRAASASTNTSGMIVPAGSVVYFILQQLGEGSAPTSVIPTAGTAVARGEDEPRIIVPTNCTQYIIDHDGGEMTGSVAPGSTFDLSVSQFPALNGKYVQRLRFTPGA